MSTQTTDRIIENVYVPHDQYSEVKPGSVIKYRGNTYSIIAWLSDFPDDQSQGMTMRLVMEPLTKKDIQSRYDDSLLQATKQYAQAKENALEWYQEALSAIENAPVIATTK